MKKFISSLAFLSLALCATAQVPSGEGRRWAVVDLSVNFMREAPDYTAELGDQALMGTVVEIVGEEGYWRQTVSPDPYKAWVTELGLVEMPEQRINEYISSPKYICTANYSRVYAEPSFKSGQVSDLVMGDLLLQVTGKRGKAVRKGRFLACALPSGRTGWVAEADVEDFAAWAASRELTGQNIVSTAMKFLGVPYMWGGTSIKEADCSGLARCVYLMNGLLLPRNASQQARTGVEVPLDALEPGDLLFFGTPADGDKPERYNHVGIYIGGSRFIHASHLVRISSLDSSAPDFYERRPLRARRIIGHGSGAGVTPLTDSPFYFIQPKLVLKMP